MQPVEEPREAHTPVGTAVHVLGSTKRTASVVPWDYEDSCKAGGTLVSGGKVQRLCPLRRKQVS